jgi:hypothetical protein
VAGRDLSGESATARRIAVRGWRDSRFAPGAEGRGQPLRLLADRLVMAQSGPLERSPVDPRNPLYRRLQTRRACLAAVQKVPMTWASAPMAEARARHLTLRAALDSTSGSTRRSPRLAATPGPRSPPTQIKPTLRRPRIRLLPPPLYPLRTCNPKMDQRPGVRPCRPQRCPGHRGLGIGFRNRGLLVG